MCTYIPLYKEWTTEKIYNLFRWIQEKLYNERIKQYTHTYKRTHKLYKIRSIQWVNDELSMRGWMCWFGWWIGSITFCTARKLRRQINVIWKWAQDAKPNNRKRNKKRKMAKHKRRLQKIQARVRLSSFVCVKLS